MKNVFSSFLFLILAISCASKEERCSRRLTELVREDQKDRTFFFDMKFEDLHKLSEKDKERRKEVKELANDGCLKAREDFSAAALIFQHGDKPEHFLDAFQYSKKAVELGADSEKALMAMSLDRYLVGSGFRQLFGTQAQKTENSPCWCSPETEKSFSDEVRKNYTGKDLAGQLAWLKSIHSMKQCSRATCPGGLKTPPKGFLPEW